MVGNFAENTILPDAGNSSGEKWKNHGCAVRHKESGVTQDETKGKYFARCYRDCRDNRSRAATGLRSGNDLSRCIAVRGKRCTHRNILRAAHANCNRVKTIQRVTITSDVS